MKQHKLLQLSIVKKHDWLRRLTEIGVHTYREWSNDGTLRIGAGIAYYGIIALVPLILVAVGIAEIFFTSDDVIRYIESFIESLFGEQAAGAIPQIEQSVNGEDANQLSSAGLIGLGGLLFSATLIFIALQDALRVIWKLGKTQVFSIKKYALSFGVMLIVGTSTTLLLIAHSVISFVNHLLPDDVEVISLLTSVASVFAIYIVLCLSILVLLKSFITVELAWRDLFVSSAIISALLYVGVYALSIYFSVFADKSLYGALAGFILALVAIYYFAQIFLAGAQLSKVVAYRNGNRHLKNILKNTDPRTNRT